MGPIGQRSYTPSRRIVPSAGFARAFRTRSVDTSGIMHPLLQPGKLTIAGQTRDDR